MNIPTLTEKQKLIPPLLYKFRYLTVFHFQKLLNYKDPHRIKERLTDLKDKGYIETYDEEEVSDMDGDATFVKCRLTKKGHDLYNLIEDHYSRFLNEFDALKK